MMKVPSRDAKKVNMLTFLARPLHPLEKG